MTGPTWGPYRILETIGVGGMAEVYKVYQPAMDRYVAIKVIKAYFAEEATFLQRFLREARAVSRLGHPFILPVHDFGEDQGNHYLVMRYMDWGTLKDRVSQGLMPLPQVARIVGQVATALAYAHRQGIYHRDVKPGNILMDEEGNTYLTDFGVAKMMEASVQLTGTGVGIGTPAYMSPEQGRGDAVDARSDVYSLGVMLYEMVVGRRPFYAETPLGLVIKHINDPLPIPHTIRPDVPEPVERVILKALAKAPEDRFQTASDMAHALDAAARTVEAAPPMREGPGWGRVRLWGVLIVLVLVGAAIVVAWRPWVKPEQPPIEKVVVATTGPSTPLPTSAPTTPIPTLEPTAQPTNTPVPALAAAVEPTSTPSPTLTQTIRPTNTPQPTLRPTASPTNTSVPAATPTAQPTSTLRPPATAAPLEATPAPRPLTPTPTSPPTPSPAPAVGIEVTLSSFDIQPWGLPVSRCGLGFDESRAARRLTLTLLIENRLGQDMWTAWGVFETRTWKQSSACYVTPDGTDHGLRGAVKIPAHEAREITIAGYCSEEDAMQSGHVAFSADPAHDRSNIRIRIGFKDGQPYID